MSIENYSEELRNYIYLNTKFINDEKFQSKEELTQNTTIIEEYIEREMSFEEIKCLFFYLSYLIEDELLRKTIISNINKKFENQKIKAREMPEINYVIVYKLSEEEFLNENINKIKEYFEDYLSQLKEALEYEEIKKKMEEEAKLEEIREQERNERFVLPKISKFDIIEINNNFITISVPLYEESEIINKNKYIIRNCLERYGKTELEYVIYFFNQEKNFYDKIIFEKKKENIIKKNKYKLTVKNLESNKIYLFLLGVKFGKNYSNPTSSKFYFMTPPKKKNGNIIIYGHKEYKNNFVDVDDDEEKIVLPKGVKSYKECFENEQTLFPLLYKNKIEDISISDKRAGCIIGDGILIESGSIINIQPGDIFEGNFPKDEVIKVDDPSLIIEYYNSLPFQLEFPEKIKIKKISVGEGHCLALSNNGECYSWGENDFGQLGLGKETNEIIGNPTKIKFDIYESDGHKYITEQEPLFYDIATGNYSSLSLGIFNNKQILYFWGNGAGILNDDSTKIIQSIYPKPIIGLDNIVKIYAKFNSIGIFCYDIEKRLDVLYIHGTQKFGIDAGIGMYNKPKPIIVNYFRDNNISVIKVSFSITCMAIIGKNINNNKIEIYIRGELCKKLFDFKEYKRSFMKMEYNWSEKVVAISPQEKIIFFLLNNGVVKKLWHNGNKLFEKDIKINGYDLSLLNIDNIDKIKFHSFLGENFVIFYKQKE